MRLQQADNPPVTADAVPAPFTQGGLRCGGTNGFSQPPHPSREAASRPTKASGCWAAAVAASATGSAPLRALYTRGPWGAAVQSALSNHRALHERPLTQRGRAYIPLLRPRPRSLCRGGLYGRPEPAAIIDSLPESRPGKRAADSRPYGGNGNIYIKKLLCAAFAPRSRAVRAALEKRSVAVTASRFHWPARSREGEGSTGRDGSVERNGLRNAASWDARRAAPMGVRGPQPRRILGTFLR